MITPNQHFFGGGTAAVNRRLQHIRQTIPQHGFLRATSRIALWRDANQIGKSLGLALDAVMFCRGDHPVQTHRPPVRVAVCGWSIEQMEPLMQKIWEIVPKDEVDPRNGYDPGRGIRGKPPRIVFTSGPGAGSVIVFGTYKQGAARLAGVTLHRLIGDEPMPEQFFGEVVPRVFHERGCIRLGFTPTPDMPPVTYLRDKIEDGSIEEFNYGLKVENCHPIGAPFPWTTKADIEEFEKTLLPIEREMRMGRSWDPVITGRWLVSFTDSNVAPIKIRDLKGAWLAVGVDHGAAANKQTAMLVAVIDRQSSRPRVFFIDEYVVEGITTPEHDAIAIIKMLKKHGLTIDDIDIWVGDRPTGSDRYMIGKSNRDLRREIAAQLGRPLGTTKPILTPKKWAGSMTYGMRLLDNIFGRRTGEGVPHGLVHPRCKVFIDACKKFNGDPRHPLKDVMDAGRYAVERSVSSVAHTFLRVRY